MQFDGYEITADGEVLNLQGAASFQRTLEICKLSKKRNEALWCLILGKRINVQPTDNPHDIYRLAFSEYSVSDK